MNNFEDWSDTKDTGEVEMIIQRAREVEKMNENTQKALETIKKKQEKQIKNQNKDRQPKTRNPCICKGNGPT